MSIEELHRIVNGPLPKPLETNRSQWVLAYMHRHKCNCDEAEIAFEKANHQLWACCT